MNLFQSIMIMQVQDISLLTLIYSGPMKSTLVRIV